MTKLAIATIALTLTATMACGGEETASSDTSGGNNGGEGGGGSDPGAGGGGGETTLNDWSCIGEVPTPEFEDGPGISGTVQLVEFTSSAPIEGATVAICYQSDPLCDTPLGGGGTTDANGLVDVLVPTDAAYYYEVTGMPVAPQLVFVLPIAEEGFEVRLAVLNPTTLELFLSFLQGGQEPDRGLVGLAAFDCEGNRGEDVIFEIDTADELTTLGYLTAQGVPNLSLESTTLAGQAGASNIPVGPTKSFARVNSTGELIAERRFSVRPGFVSFPAPHFPTPQP